MTNVRADDRKKMETEQLIVQFWFQQLARVKNMFEVGLFMVQTDVKRGLIELVMKRYRIA